jgi:dipeptidyl aminopeptidase/acylaminoacyl peptidase
VRTISRRRMLGSVAMLGAVAPALSGADVDGMQRPGRDASPIGNRWPQPDERYFYGRAADRREMQRLNTQITPGDVEGFKAAWTAAADQHEQRAARAATAGRHVTARDHFATAATYHSQVQNLFLRLGRRDAMVEGHDRMTAAFKRAWHKVDPPFEAVEIPFGGTSLPGLFFRAHGNGSAPAPVIVELNGIDHIKERIYFRSQWIPYVERGLNYLTFDGPGQGESLAKRGILLRPDSETAASAAIDFVAKRPDVDTKRIGVFGTSFGGYFAPRAAATDARIKAMASRASVFDALEDAFDFCPMIREQLRLLLGVATLEEARDRLRPFTLRDLAPKIRCPVFITHGSRDDIVSVASARKFEAAIVARDKRVAIVEGAGHNPGDESETEQIDWIAEKLRAG